MEKTMKFSLKVLILVCIMVYTSKQFSFGCEALTSANPTFYDSTQVDFSPYCSKSFLTTIFKTHNLRAYVQKFSIQANRRYILYAISDKPIKLQYNNIREGLFQESYVSQSSFGTGQRFYLKTFTQNLLHLEISYQLDSVYQNSLQPTDSVMVGFFSDTNQVCNKWGFQSKYGKIVCKGCNRIMWSIRDLTTYSTCMITNCLVQEGMVCTTCEPKYVKYNGLCYPQVQNCMIQTEYTCDQCKDTFMANKVKNQCFTPVPNCQIHDVNTNKCSKCNLGYTQKDGICLKSIDNCVTQVGDICTQCSPYYIPDSTSTSCKYTHCVQQVQKVCQKCQSGWYLVKTVDISKCVVQVKQCANYSLQKCIFCLPGYTVNPRSSVGSCTKD